MRRPPSFRNETISNPYTVYNASSPTHAAYYPYCEMQGLLRDVLELVKAHGSNGKTRYSIKPLEEKLSFDKGFYVFIRAIQLLVNRNKGVVLVRDKANCSHMVDIHDCYIHYLQVQSNPFKVRIASLHSTSCVQGN